MQPIPGLASQMNGGNLMPSQYPIASSTSPEPHSIYYSSLPPASSTPQCKCNSGFSKPFKLYVTFAYLWCFNCWNLFAFQIIIAIQPLVRPGRVRIERLRRVVCKCRLKVTWFQIMRISAQFLLRPSQLSHRSRNHHSNRRNFNLKPKSELMLCLLLIRKRYRRWMWTMTTTRMMNKVRNPKKPWRWVASFAKFYQKMSVSTKPFRIRTLRWLSLYWQDHSRYFEYAQTANYKALKLCSEFYCNLQ